MTTASIPRSSSDRAHRSHTPLRDLVKTATPISVASSAFVVVIGLEIALAVVGSVVGLLITGLLYIAIIGGLILYIVKKGAYWHAPFAAQPPRRGFRR